MNNKMVALVGAAVFAFAANAVDFYWTGEANDGLWSSVGNWATDAQGTPATVAPKKNDRADYHFNVPAGGLTVTVDSSSGIIVSNLVVTTESTDPVELKIVSSASGREFDFTQGASMTVGDNVTLVLNTDMGGSWTAQNLPKYGAGTVVFDLVYRTPQTSRPLVIKEGKAVVASTSMNPRFAVTMEGRDPANPPVFENQLENGLYGHLIANGLGDLKLNGKTLKVGDVSVNNSSTNLVPSVVDTGTLSYVNERVAVITEKNPKYAIELDRADLLCAPQVVVDMLFDDDTDPKKDELGSGSRLVSVGSPVLADDSERGSVLSLDGSSGFKGPDADAGLAEFDPAHGFTLSLWLKPASDCADTGRVFFFGENQNSHAVALRLHNHSQTNLMFGTWGTNIYLPVTNLKDGNWHHFAVTFNGKANYTSFKFYYDGELILSKSPWITCAQPNMNFYLGNVQYSAWSGAYKGLLDEFFLSSRVLAYSEIRDIYANGLANYAGALSIGALTAKSAGVLSVEGSASVKTISGKALAGGVQLVKDGSTLTLGTDAGEAASDFQGTIAGTNSTLVKAGSDYALTLKGAVKGFTNVVVNAGTLALGKPLASAIAELPEPVARWTFDGEDPLVDTTGNPALKLTEASTNDTYNVTFVSGDAICGKAAKFTPSTGNGFLKLDTFPTDIIPAGGSTFTAIARYRPGTTQVKDGALCVVGWGTASGYNTGLLFRIGPYQDNTQSARCVINNSSLHADDSYCTYLGNNRTRWYTVAVVHNAKSVKLYVDGVLVKSGTTTFNITADMFAIGSSYTGNKAFTGYVDDIQIYDCALSDGQVRMVAEQLEASKGKSATDAAVPAGVLMGTPDVTVADGATLRVASTENVGKLSGAGTVEIAPLARLGVSSADGFSGTVTGEGLLGIADGAVLEFGDGSQPLLDIDRPIAIGKNVTVNTTVRAGRLLIAEAASFVGAENLETWPATVNGRRCRFVVSGGTGLYLKFNSGLALLLR